jgi:HEAT repeat protein
MRRAREVRSLSLWTRTSRAVGLALLGCLVAGCGNAESVTSGGRTAAYWADVLEQQNKDVTLRRKAATKLGALILIDKAAFPAVLAALKDPDADVRGLAARSLGLYSGTKGGLALPALHALQEQERDKKVLEAVEKALVRLEPAS